MWNNGDITFMEVIQEANIGGEYLRYLYLNNSDNKYYQITVKTNASDTPFRQLQKDKIKEFIYSHQGDKQTLMFKCERKRDYIYHFTLIKQNKDNATPEKDSDQKSSKS